MPQSLRNLQLEHQSLGLLLDIFSGVFLGFYPVIYLLVYSMIKGISRRIAINEFAYQLPLAVFSYLVIHVGMYLFLFLLSPETPVYWPWRTILLQLLMLGVIGMPVFAIFEMFFQFSERLRHIGLTGGDRAANRFR